MRGREGGPIHPGGQGSELRSGDGKALTGQVVGSVLGGRLSRHKAQRALEELKRSAVHLPMLLLL